MSTGIKVSGNIDTAVERFTSEDGREFVHDGYEELAQLHTIRRTETPESFAALVGRYAIPDKTIVYSEIDERRITAVLDDADPRSLIVQQYAPSDELTDWLDRKNLTEIGVLRKWLRLRKEHLVDKGFMAKVEMFSAAVNITHVDEEKDFANKKYAFEVKGVKGQVEMPQYTSIKIPYLRFGALEVEIDLRIEVELPSQAGQKVRIMFIPPTDAELLYVLRDAMKAEIDALKKSLKGGPAKDVLCVEGTPTTIDRGVQPAQRRREPAF